ncbi:PDZ domain-containing protein [Sphingomonas sp.]|uniref:PDZ domain-containing protein n=1 Tax=Sphingomonas sp. TaxID=28214 RepID=UPI0035C7B10D
MNDLRFIRRAAQLLAMLALLGGALALRALHANRGVDGTAAGATLTGSLPVVTSLKAHGAADRAGLRVGDVIERVDGRVPQSLAQVERTMASGQHTELAVRRAGHLADVIMF